MFNVEDEQAEECEAEEWEGLRKKQFRWKREGSVTQESLWGSGRAWGSSSGRRKEQRRGPWRRAGKGDRASEGAPSGWGLEVSGPGWGSQKGGCCRRGTQASEAGAERTAER